MSEAVLSEFCVVVLFLYYGFITYLIDYIKTYQINFDPTI